MSFILSADFLSGFDFRFKSFNADRFLRLSGREEADFLVNLVLSKQIISQYS